MFNMFMSKKEKLAKMEESKQKSEAGRKKSKKRDD